MSNALVYDIEIEKGILGRGEQPHDGIEYCAGWHDHANMGISVIGAYDYKADRYRVFMRDNFPEFIALCGQRAPLVSFNGLSFDDMVIRASGLAMPDKTPRYDLLVEIWKASGLGPKFQYPSHAGFGLDACCEANFGTRKTGNGALAPVLWQRGEIGQVIDYCLNDIKLTKQLFDMVLTEEVVKCPKTGDFLKLAAVA